MDTENHTRSSPTVWSVQKVSRPVAYCWKNLMTQAPMTSSTKPPSDSIVSDSRAPAHHSPTITGTSTSGNRTAFSARLSAT